MYLSNKKVIVLVLVLCVNFGVKAQENPKNETLNKTIQVLQPNDTSKLIENDTKLFEKNLTIERIVQPMIRSNLKNENEKNIKINIGNQGEKKKMNDFKPSPKVEFPEAKFFSNSHQKEINWNTQSYNKEIKFPESQQKNIHPYPFVSTDYYKNYYNYNINPSSTSTHNKKQDDNIGMQPPITEYINHGEYQNPQSFTQLEKYEGGNDERRYRPEYNYELEVQEKPYELENQFPWKKIVKFLTTFVPIGILLSTLIPNVISITPINNVSNAQSRSRVDGNLNKNEKETEIETKSKMQLVYSSKLARDFKRKGCDHRILCELLLGAGYSKNPEENAEHLLETYVEKEQEITEKTEELKKIMVAVNNGNCQQFKCNSFIKGRIDYKHKIV